MNSKVSHSHKSKSTIVNENINDVIDRMFATNDDDEKSVCMDVDEYEEAGLGEP